MPGEKTFLNPALTTFFTSKGLVHKYFLGISKLGENLVYCYIVYSQW